MIGGEVTEMDKPPEFRDKWILGWFAIWFVLFVPLGMSSVPDTHGAYWREVLILPVMMGFIFTFLAGLVRPAGWLSLLGLMAMGRFLPELGSTNLQIYFWLASYFTLFFSLSERLTLGKILKVASITGTVLVFAYLLDPVGDRRGFGQGILNWLVLIACLVGGNGLMRFSSSLLKPKEPGRLDWIEDV